MTATLPEGYVYLDYAATAPLSIAAAEAMGPFLVPGSLGIASGTNANSLSRPGRIAFELLETARKRVAASIGARRPDEILFTSGATESDNAALLGIAQALAGADVRQAGASSSGHRGRVIVSMIEHDAVLSTADRLESDGFEVIRLKPDRDGFIEVRALEDALTDDTSLVSIQLANSEIGSIQPIRQLAALAHKCGALFHTDATQALGKMRLDVQELGVDAASFSGHKLGAPKGVGFLYLKARTPFRPQVLGGGQEAGRRSGTQNVCGVVAMAAACSESVCDLEDESQRLRDLRDKLYRALQSFDAIQATVDVDEGSLDYLPNIVSVLVDGVESDTLILCFDSLGFAVSGGSACSSASLEPSHVLTSLGIPKDQAQCALRISFGRFTTREDIDAFLAAVPHVLDWSR